MARSDDPYVLPNGTLRNKLGATTPEQLSILETNLSTVRARAIAVSLPGPPFTFEMLRDIHRSLFQDVYEWAGEARTTTLAKREFDDPRSAMQTFAPPEAIEPRMKAAFALLAARSNLERLSTSDFGQGAAELLAALNHVHFAREGNGRTNRLLLSAVASNAGHELDFSIVTRERMVAVSIQSHKGDISGMRRMFDEMLDPRQLQAMRRVTSFLRTTPVPWNDLYVATTRAGQDYRGTLVQRAGQDFLMRVDNGKEAQLLVGDAADLPADVSNKSQVALRATQFPLPAQATLPKAPAVESSTAAAKPRQGVAEAILSSMQPAASRPPTAPDPAGIELGQRLQALEEKLASARRKPLVAEEAEPEMPEETPRPSIGPRP
ncbi:MAG: Fic/DOC family protein [Janthinobacterium lividum]